MKRQERKFEESEELEKAAQATVEEFMNRHRDDYAKQFMILGAPDFYLKSLVKKLALEKEGFTADDFVEYVQAQRDRDPNFLEPVGPDSPSGQLHMQTTGASYDMARHTANITNSYLVTDLYSKWREIEIDRESQNAESKVWSPFAKAVQNAPLKYFDNLGLEHALRLRQEGRLESLRSFFLGVWKRARTAEPFDEANGRLLAEELTQEIAKAENEWKEIDQDLLKLAGKEIAVGFLAGGPLIAAGHGMFVAAAAAVVGGTTVANSVYKHMNFANRFPAAFFMKIEKEKVAVRPSL